MMLNRNCLLVIASGLAFLISAQTSHAQNGSKSNEKAADEPTIEDLQKSSDRDFHFVRTDGHGISGGGGSAKPAGTKKPEKAKTMKKAGNSAAKRKRPIVRRVPASTPVRVSPTKRVQKKVVPASHQTDILPGTTSGLVVKARLDKDGVKPTYRVGEKMQLKVTANQDCNIVVMDYDTQGQLTQLFPNDYQTSSFLKAGETIAIGGPQSPFEYEITGAAGEEKIFVYAYPVTDDSPLAVAFNSVPDSPFRSTEMSLEEYRDLVNKSKVFFSRSVKVVPKSGTKLVSHTQKAAAPNKVHLSFIVQK